MKNIEIEKKFLVKYLPDLRGCEKHFIKQGYICTDPVLRIRQKDERYMFTFKGKGEMIREEIEADITREQFTKLLEKVENELIIKTRYIVSIDNGLKAELDIYEGNLKGFMNVEVEFNSLEEANSFKPPIWFGKDITEDEKYKNAYLSKVSTIDNKKCLEDLF